MAATLPIATVLTAVKNYLTLLAGTGQDLAVMRYVSMAATAQEAIYQILSIERSFPSLIITPGDFRVVKRFTSGAAAGSNYDYEGTFTIWIAADSILDMEGSESVSDLYDWEALVRVALDNQTLSVTGLQRILWQSVGAPVVVSIESEIPEFILTPVQFAFIGKEMH